jgi:hypothetical protein
MTAQRKGKTQARKLGRRAARTVRLGVDPTGSLHVLFVKQAEIVIANSTASEDEKLQMLVAMSCPCCGWGGASFSIKLKRRQTPRYSADDGD